MAQKVNPRTTILLPGKDFGLFHLLFPSPLAFVPPFRFPLGVQRCGSAISLPEFRIFPFFCYLVRSALPSSAVLFGLCLLSPRLETAGKRESG